jgi:hypothetical protein
MQTGYTSRQASQSVPSMVEAAAQVAEESKQRTALRESSRRRFRFPRASRLRFDTHRNLTI